MQRLAAAAPRGGVCCTSAPHHHQSKLARLLRVGSYQMTLMRPQVSSSLDWASKLWIHKGGLASRLLCAVRACHAACKQQPSRGIEVLWHAACRPPALAWYCVRLYGTQATACGRCITLLFLGRQGEACWPLKACWWPGLEWVLLPQARPRPRCAAPRRPRQAGSYTAHWPHTVALPLPMLLSQG